jgi:hypothetical protein
MFKTLVLAAALTGGLASMAFAQDPVSAAIGTAGAIAGGAVNTAGAIAGDAVDTAAGTADAVTGYPYSPYNRPCPMGYWYQDGVCYPR